MSGVGLVDVLPVILAGGTGTRLWPLSRAMHPKQFLALPVANVLREETLFQQAALRICLLKREGLRVLAPCVVTNEEQRFTVIEQLRAVGVPAGAVLLEPAGRNTAPALTLAALAARTAEQPDPIMVVAPADHAVQDQSAFASALRRAVDAATEGQIVVLGVKPDRPDVGYGYIRSTRGELGLVETVEAFVEKPDMAAAKGYVSAGNYYWNSGMFVLRASVWLAALERFRPDIALASRAAYATSSTDALFRRFDKADFAKIPVDSIDYAVMEPASAQGSGFDMRMVPMEAGWSDLGSWNAVWQAGTPDGEGNVVHGDAILRDSRQLLVNATSRLVATIGLVNVTIIETPDAVLVADSSRSSEAKELVASLVSAGRDEATSHRRVHRPWGWYESIDQGPRFQVKRILVQPGAQLSLQMHHHRAEHWIVVSGTAQVTNGSDVLVLGENESTYIPLGQTHRLANPGKVPLEIIEVQSGSYLGEDDIVRFEDSYGRG